MFSRSNAYTEVSKWYDIKCKNGRNSSIVAFGAVAEGSDLLLWYFQVTEIWLTIHIIRA